MEQFKRFFICTYVVCASVFIICGSIPIVYADECEASAEVCAEIDSLKSRVGELQEKNGELDEIRGEDTSNRMAESIAIAGTIAVLLKMATSILRGWKGRVHKDSDKAKIKIAMIVIGVLAFLASNIGVGLPWWQAIVIAGGGPGSIAVHEVMKLIPVLQGKKKMPLSDFPPSNGEDSNEEV